MHSVYSRKKKKKAYASSEYDDMPEQGQIDNITTSTTSRPYSYSTTNAVPGCDAESHWRHTSVSAKPQQPTIQTHSRPIPVPQTMGNNFNMNNGAQPRRLATSQPTRGVPSSPSTRNGPYANSSLSSYYKTPTSGFPVTASSYTQQYSYYYPQQQPQQYRQYSNPSPNFARTLSDNTLLHPPQHQYLTPPSQPRRRQSLRNNRASKGGSSSSGSGSGGNRSPSPYNRHKDFKRTAMRGILGASAIGGFMDALEAFSII